MNGNFCLLLAFLREIIIFFEMISEVIDLHCLWNLSNSMKRALCSLGPSLFPSSSYLGAKKIRTVACFGPPLLFSAVI